MVSPWRSDQKIGTSTPLLLPSLAPAPAAALLTPPRAGSIGCPTLFLSSRQDEIVNCEHMDTLWGLYCGGIAASKRSEPAAQLPDGSTFIKIPDGMHNNAWLTAGYYTHIDRFVSSLKATSSSGGRGGEGGVAVGITGSGSPEKVRRRPTALTGSPGGGSNYDGDGSSGGGGGGGGGVGEGEPDFASPVKQRKAFKDL